jgi:hypothetical protein
MKMTNYCVFKRNGTFTKLLFLGREKKIPTAFITHTFTDSPPLKGFDFFAFICKKANPA